MENLHILMYKIFEHGLWLSSRTEHILAENTGNAISIASEKLEEYQKIKYLDTRLLAPNGKYVSIPNFSDRHIRNGWLAFWNTMQYDLKLRLRFKTYGLRDGNDWNLSCPDFRCSGKFLAQNGPSYCSSEHYSEDPFAVTRGVVYNVTSKEDLARRLDQLRGSKEFALSRLEAWQKKTETDLTLWNPF